MPKTSMFVPLCSVRVCPRRNKNREKCPLILFQAVSRAGAQVKQESILSEKGCFKAFRTFLENALFH